MFVCLNYMSVCMSVCMCTRMWACLCVCAYYVMCLIAVTSYHIGGLGEAYNCTIRAVTRKILSSSRTGVLALSTVMIIGKHDRTEITARVLAENVRYLNISDQL